MPADMALAEQFLEQVFTSNLEQRYDDFSSADITEETALNDAASQYYQGFEELVTEECLEKFIEYI